MEIFLQDIASQSLAELQQRKKEIMARLGSSDTAAQEEVSHIFFYACLLEMMTLLGCGGSVER